MRLGVFLFCQTFLKILQHIIALKIRKARKKMKDFYPEGWLKDTAENKKNMATPSALALAQMNETVLESKVIMCDAEHNMTVDLGGITGIIPRNEGAVGISDGTTKDIALISRVGRPVCFTVKSLNTDDSGKIFAILSRKDAQEKCLKHILNTKRAGDVIDAKITHLESFGAFCDVGCGNVALLPIDAISVSRISHPRDRFNVGDDIKAIIKSVSADNRITLSLKELLGTWEENADLFLQGQTVSGIVRSIEDYGIFIELTPNLAGLAEPKANVRVGQQASVYIKSIIPEKMKIKLIVIDSFDAECFDGIHYFNTAEHISEWNYSPFGCDKKITSSF